MDPMVSMPDLSNLSPQPHVVIVDGGFGGLAVARHLHRTGAQITIVGRAFAVVQTRRWKFSGFAAWVTWLWVHIFYLTQFTNRVLVVIQWGWNYLTRNRSARIFTGYSAAEGKP
jgi:NADH dehydrogenase